MIMHCANIFFLSFLLLLSNCFTDGANTITVHIISSPEWNALRDFYYSLHGSHWAFSPFPYSLKVWNVTSSNRNFHFCNCTTNCWQGLRAEYVTIAQYSNCTVRLISLDGYNLTGTLPSSISNLKLASLTVRNNYIHGTIPPSICSMTQLSYFSVNANFLVGAIPDCIDALTALTTFDVKQNSLSRGLPRSFSKLLILKNLDVSHNKFTGSRWLFV